MKRWSLTRSMKLNYRIMVLFAATYVGIHLAYFERYYNSSSPQTPRPKRVYFELVKSLNLRNGSKTEKLSRPECENILVNMTRGKWIKKVDLKLYTDRIEEILQQEERQFEELKEFWMKSGIQSQAWSLDFRCGYKNFQTQPSNSKWPKVGSWCDPDSQRPCCTNNFTGTCMPAFEQTCDCLGCVDLRKYKYAESSDWIVDDKNCKWRNYTASEICDVIERSPFLDIYYVGDSFMRKMFRTLSVMITDDFEYGGVDLFTSPSLQELCKGLRQYYYLDCRPTVNDISQVYRTEKLCGGRGFMDFQVQFNGFYSNNQKTHFLNLVKTKLGVKGSLIVLGVGAHMGCDFLSVIDKYLGPAIDIITERYGSPTMRKNSRRLSGRWPQIIFCLPPQMGLLKPTKYLKSPSTESCIKFGKDMRRYAERHDISVVDFRPITQFLHSYDGTHHALGVNRLKNLIILNYIASLDAV